MMKQSEIKKMLADYIAGCPIEVRKINSGSGWTLCESAIDNFDFQTYEYRTAKDCEEFQLIKMLEKPNEFEYFGFNFYRFPGYNFVATDLNGDIYAYKEKPFFKQDSWYCNSPFLEVFFLGNFEYSGDPAKSLKELK